MEIPETKAVTLSKSIIRLIKGWDYDVYKPEVNAQKSLSEEEPLSERSITSLKNYPNPFTNNTLIEYEVTIPYESIRLLIYNANGQLLKSEVLNQNQGVVLLDNDLWNAGVYFCILEVNGQIISQLAITKVE